MANHNAQMAGFATDVPYTSPMSRMNPMHTTISFRPARQQDLDHIMELEARGFAPGNRELRDVYAQRIQVFPEGSLMAHLGQHCVGCVFSEIWQAVSIPSAEQFALGHAIEDRHDPVRGRVLYITSMTIDPAFRGHRLGLPLFVGCLDHLARAFPQLDSALLLVNETWSRARKIYLDAGFVEIARFRDFFNPSGAQFEEGIVMHRRIG